jgi:hypothetical protein
MDNYGVQEQKTRILNFSILCIFILAYTIYYTN